MNHFLKLLIVTAVTVSAVTSAQAVAVQITDVQSGLMGITQPLSVTTTLSDDSGSTRNQIGGGWANLVDGNNATFGTNLAAGNFEELGYIGVRFNSAQTNVTSVELDIQIFGDGGWWNGGSTLDGPTNGVEPTIQFTTTDISSWTEGNDTVVNNSDNIWTTVSAISDYPTGVNETTSGGAAGAGVSDGDTFTWNFSGINNVRAIRIIGSMGGLTGGGDTFIAGEEIRAFSTPIPEPSAFALASLALGSLGFVGWRRWKMTG